MSSRIVISDESYEKAHRLIRQLHELLHIDNPHDTFLIRLMEDVSIDFIQSMPTYKEPVGEVIMIRHMKNKNTDGFDCL